MEIEMLVLIAIAVILFIMIWPRILNYAEYWPTSVRKSKKMLKISGLMKGEQFYDLGCGDGRIVILADKLGAKAIGIEIDPFRYFIAKILVFLFARNAKIEFGSYLEYNFNDADVIAVFLKPKPMQQLEKKLKGLKKGTRIVSHMWKFPNLKPVSIDEKEKIFLYVVR